MAPCWQQVGFCKALLKHMMLMGLAASVHLESHVTHSKIRQPTATNQLYEMGLQKLKLLQRSDVVAVNSPMLLGQRCCKPVVTWLASLCYNTLSFFTGIYTFIGCVS
jgi:hypothetical protein